MVLRHNLAFIGQVTRPDDEDRSTKLMNNAGDSYQLSMITIAIKMDGVITREMKSGLQVEPAFWVKRKGMHT